MGLAQQLRAELADLVPHRGRVGLGARRDGRQLRAQVHADSALANDGEMAQLLRKATEHLAATLERGTAAGDAASRRSPVAKRSRKKLLRGVLSP